MSSVQRDLADYVLSVYRDAVSLDFESMTKEELVKHIKGEGEAAKHHYIDFAIAYGWYYCREAAEKDLKNYERK